MSFSSSNPPHAWRIVGLLWVVGCLNYLDRVMLTTMRGSLLEAIPMSDAQFGLLTSVFLWVYGAASPFAGFLADRTNRSRCITGSLLVWSAMTWLTGHAKTFEELLAARACMGISEAAYLPAALALITDYHRGATRSLATGVHLTGVGIGAALGGLGGWLAERHGWSFAFNFFGIVGIVYSLVLALALRDPPSSGVALSPAPGTAPKVALGEAVRSLFGSGSYRLILAYWGLIAVVGWAFVGWIPTYLGERFHLAQGTAGFSGTGYLQSALMAGLLIGGVWADRWSRTRLRASVLVAVIGLGAAALAVGLTATAGTLWIALAGLTLFGLTRGLADVNTMPMLCLVVDRRYRATGFGIMNLVACVIGGLSIYAGGALRDAHVNVRALFLFGAVCTALCSVVLSFVTPRRDATPSNLSTT